MPNESDDQWAVRNINQVVESLQMTLLGVSTHTAPVPPVIVVDDSPPETFTPVVNAAPVDDPTIPSFSLGLSQDGMY